MSINNITVLSSLPKFTGNPKKGEPYFESDIDARTFLRAVESHFDLHNIDGDQQKIRTLFSLIDTKRGNAIRLVQAYSGKAVTFEQVKRTFIKMYPSIKITELREASKNLLDTRIDDQDIFCSMTSLETATRAVAEAYLRTDKLTQGAIGEKTRVTLEKTPPNFTTTEAQTASTISARPPPPTTSPPTTPPPATRSPPASATTTPSVLLADILQNFAMHMFISSQIHHKVYEKVVEIGPYTPSTELMGEVVSEIARHKALNKTTSKSRVDEETVWKTSQSTQQRPLRRNLPENNRSHNQKCFNCKKEGHTRSNCPNCGFCKAPGHTPKTCQKRIAAAKGKYCSYCKISDSHNFAECRKRLNTSRGGIRVIQTTDEANEENLEDTFGSNIFEDTIPEKD